MQLVFIQDNDVVRLFFFASEKMSKDMTDFVSEI